MDPLKQPNNSEVGSTSTEAINGIRKALFTKQANTSFHNGKTITTEHSNRQRDARQSALTLNLARDKIVRQWFLEGSFMQN